MATTYDIAKLTGLNQSTVSRVLSGFPRIKPSTVEKVMEACRQLNYVPHASAKALKTNRTSTLAIHMPHGSSTVLADPFVPVFLNAVSVTAARQGYSVILSTADESSTESSLATLVRSRRVDGVIMTSPRQNDPCIETLLTENVPFVTGRIDRQRLGRWACVDVDNRHAGRLAAEFLMSRGHRRIAVITEPADSIVGNDFCEGVSEAMAAKGVKFLAAMRKSVPITFEAASEATRELLSSKTPVDAIIASTALTAFGVIESVRAMDREMVVLGVESPLLASMYPNRPRIQTPIDELGRRMAETLMDLLEGRVSSQPAEQRLYVRVVDETGRAFCEEAKS